MTRNATSNEMLELMHALVLYRAGEVRPQLSKVVEAASMLHLDALIVTYHFAKMATGQVLEIGAFLGGSTIAAALGVRASASAKKIISIEPGGQLKKHRLASKDIFRDLKKNLTRFGVSDLVTLLQGHSFDPAVIAHVQQTFAPETVGLFMFDADDNPARDFAAYGELLADGCFVTVDDYVTGAEEKVGPTRAQVDMLVMEGRLEPLGYYGWGTWVGKWRRDPLPTT
jgi:predicted O-methyltransferase YrrM